MTSELSQGWVKWSAEESLNENILKWRGKNVDIPGLLSERFEEVRKVVSAPTISDDSKQIQEALIHAICNLAVAHDQVRKGYIDYQITIETKTAEINSFLDYSMSRHCSDWSVQDYIDFVHGTNEPPVPHNT